MAGLIAEHGTPAFIRSDNGPELIGQVLCDWLKQQETKTLYIDPGCPWQNGDVESFHDKFRRQCLSREQLWTLTEARVVIEDFRRDYNEDRPHSRRGYLSPTRFAATQPPSLSPVGLRPPYARDGQTTTNTTTSTQPSDSHTA